jgi:type II secretory pathway predicted ATPase ExeA
MRAVRPSSRSRAIGGFQESARVDAIGVSSQFEDLGPMYESFFHLKSRPFAAAPAVHSYFPGESIEQARQTSIRVVERAEGPVLLIGPAGIGKSLLCRLLAASFGPSFRVALLSNTQICTHKELLQNILFELGMRYRDMDEGELRLSLTDHLRPDHDTNGLLLIVDEAHTLPIRLLEEIRMITNVVVDGQPRVRLVLAGGSRLDERFASPKLESFNQRVAARCYLQPLRWDETDQYVRTQLACAGGAADRIFTEDAFRAIFRASDGIPRLINQVCNHALTLACQSGQRTIDAAGIEEAWADLQQLPAPWLEKSVEADSSKAVVEFGELGAVDPDVVGADDASDCGADDASFVTTGVLELDPAAADLVPDAASELADEPEEAGDELPEPAVDPFDAPFAEEEVVVDHFAALSAEAKRPVVVEAPAADEPVPPEPVDSTPADAPAAVEMASEEPAPPEQVTIEANAEDEPIDEAGVPDEDREADHHDLQPASEVASSSEFRDAEPPADMLSSFECAVYEAADGPSVVLDTSGMLPPSLDDHDDRESNEVAECVSLPWISDTPRDDRDLLALEDVEEEEPAEDRDPQAEQDQGDSTPVRRVEYRELFAQLRRDD